MIHVLASSWYDPGSNGFDIGDALDIALVIGAVYGAIRATASGVRWADARRDKAHRLDVLAIMAPVLTAQTETLMTALEAATKPIQPTTNGGLSLPDVHVTLNRIEGKVDAVDERLTAVEAEQHAAKGQRDEILAAAEVNARAAQAALAELGAEIKFTPLLEDKTQD